MKISANQYDDENASDHIHWDSNCWGINTISKQVEMVDESNDSEEMSISDPEWRKKESINFLLKRIEDKVQDINIAIEQIRKLSI
jgi:hypothetical protein